MPTTRKTTATETPAEELDRPARFAALRRTFPEEAVGQLPRSTCRDCSLSQRKRCDRHQWVTGCQACGGSHSSATMHISYVGHADVTARLLEVDPEWTWEPFTTDQLNGIPPEMRKGLWINLTVLGVTRPGFGDTENGKGAKEAIGDALRNAAMRFGVALDLWAKGDREWAHAEKVGAEEMHPDEAPPRQQEPPGQRPSGPPPAPYAGPTTAELLIMIDQHAAHLGKTYDEVTAKFRHDHGDLSLDDLDTLEPQVLAPLEAALSAWITKNAAEGK